MSNDARAKSGSFVINGPHASPALNFEIGPQGPTDAINDVHPGQSDSHQ